MANIKKLIALSEWLTYELETTILDPPILKIKVRPINAMATTDVGIENLKFGAVMIEMVIDAVQEWDIADEGNPILCNDEMKRLHLPFLLSQKIKGKDTLLGIEVLRYAGDIEHFIRP